MVSSTTVTYPRDLQALLDVLPHLNPSDKTLIERAYYRAEQSHSGQTRKSGEPYFTHCVAVAGILADLRMDAETIAAGLLHDVVEDTPVTLEDIRNEFGAVVAQLVNGVTKLAHLPMKPVGQKSDSNRLGGTINKEVEYIRKMFMMMNDDIRVVLVKLADRLHNMRTLGFMKPEKQKEIAHETLEIFAPLANRLGIWQIKWELEDLSFRYMDPEAYRMIATKLDEKRADRERYIQSIGDRLRKELEAHGIQNTIISGRPKHIYSIYKKMKRKDVALDGVYDVRAVRVIVEDVIQCYPVLGIVHQLWRPIQGEFDDYIAAPKDNFYRSLHTAVRDENGKTLEVQIRTREMHEDAEYGIAAHWRYKEGNKGTDEAFNRRIEYLRRLMDDVRDDEQQESSQAFVDRMKEEVFEERVYVSTPKGDLIDLPVGATPIDFAYHIHTEIGNRCRGAKVNGKLVPLTYQIRMGDQVEIVTAARGGPSMDWLNEALGFVKTSRARAKIRHWFKRQNRDKHIVWGRESLERELKRLGLLERVTFEAVSKLFEYEKLEDFLADIGVGDISGAQITNRVLEDERRREEANRLANLTLKPNSSTRHEALPANGGVTVMGLDGLMYSLAKCCTPMPGDDIIGYITRGRGVSVHRADCTNMRGNHDLERRIEVHWGSTAPVQRYVVPLEITAHDREGLLRDVTTLIADEKINITSVDVSTRQQIATLRLKIEIRGPEQLARILNRVGTVTSVVDVQRPRQ